MDRPLGRQWKGVSKSVTLMTGEEAIPEAHAPGIEKAQPTQNEVATTHSRSIEIGT